MKFLFGILLGSQLAFAQFSIEKSSEIFFPFNTRELLTAQQNFPVFWWNFAILENVSNHWDLARKYCQELNQFESVNRAECNFDIDNYFVTIRDWARDLPLREPKWKESEIKKRFKQSLVQASVILGNATMSKVILADPLQTWRDLKSHAEERLKTPFPRQNGIFYDKDTDRAIIPILFRFPPAETDGFQIFQEKFPELKVIGPHKSFYENESVVVKDVKIVSAIGTLILIAFAAFLYLCKRARAILLIPPVLLAIYLAGLVTSLFFNGSLHGLTLAFGSGIIGLTLDYGLHGALNHKSKNTWVSNTIGFLTTSVGLIVLGFSDIPLFRQIAIFSILGLSFGMVFYYFLLKAFPRKFTIEPFEIDPKLGRSAVGGLFLLVSAAVVGSFFVKPSLSLHRFNFESVADQKIAAWVREKMELTPPLMRFHKAGSVLAESERELSWAKENQIKVENAAVYVPSEKQQKSNAASWKNCESSHQIFSGYFQMLCSEHTPLNLTKEVPHYLSHLYGKDNFLTLWMTRPDQESKVREKFPDAKSLTEILLTLPEKLQSELRWMVPTALLLVSLIILGYYRTFSSLFFAITPFFSGLGMVFVVTLLLQKDITFITVVGLIMVFGFSIDYGIFMGDIYREGDEQESSSNVITALSFAALLNMVGFAPMLFAEHPVLKDLGIALFFGTLGAYLGSVWGLPAVMQTLALHKKTI